MIFNDKENTVYSFLMIGQSNMAGRGEFSDVAPIENYKCRMLRMGRWQKMSEPINPDREILDGEYHSGVSLAASFADEVSRHFGIQVGLIPCADGGTGISQWMPGEILYDHAVMMARLAMRTSRLCGIIWHQGETDCKTEDTLSVYGEKFISLMNSLRSDLGVGNIPIIIGELAESIGERWDMDDRPKRMNELFYRLAEKLPACAVVSADTLTLKPDGLHFDSRSLRIFGVRYAQKYIQLADDGI